MNDREIQQQLPLPDAGSEAGGMFVLVIIVLVAVVLHRAAPDVPFVWKAAVAGILAVVATRHPGKAIVVMLAGIGWLLGTY
jgi:hypothetical protein